MTLDKGVEGERAGERASRRAGEWARGMETPGPWEFAEGLCKSKGDRDMCRGAHVRPS
jgi:hypothetical protein